MDIEIVVRLVALLLAALMTGALMAQPFTGTRCALHD